MLENKSKINFGQQMVVPTHKDLISSQKYNIPFNILSEYSVFVRKISSKHRKEVVDSLETDKRFLRYLHQKFKSYKFLVNFQYKKKTVFNDAEMEYMEKVQQISEIKEICMNEKTETQTASEFEIQIDSWIGRNKGNKIIPVLEPYAKELIEKVAIMKIRGIEKCAIIHRGTNKRSIAQLSTALQTLNNLELYAIVFGSSRKYKKTGASKLLPPFQFKANMVSSWIAWGHGEGPSELLDIDWKFREVLKSGKGLFTYPSGNRKTLFGNGKNVELNTAISRIDTINQINIILKTFVPLPKIQFESLFN